MENQTTQQTDQSETQNSGIVAPLINQQDANEQQQSSGQEQTMTAEQYQKLLQQQLQFLQQHTQFYQQKPSVCGILFIFLLKIILSVSYTLTFGILLYIYQSNDDRNDYCEKDSLKNWAYACSIICFTHVGIQCIRIFDQMCLKSAYEDEGRCQSFIQLLEFLAGIGLFVCAIGLNVTDSSECGQLHQVSKAFYIVSYIFTGIGGLIACCILGNERRSY